MNIRPITLALGAAAGGLLAAAYLPIAIANADSGGAVVDVTSDAMRGPTPDVFGFSPDSPETVLTVSGLPPLFQQVEGYNTFDYFTTPTGDTSPVDVGSFNADVSTLSLPDGFTNTEYLVTGGQTTDEIGPNVTPDLTDAHLPTTGSVYDIANFGNGFENVYSDVVTPRALDATTDALSGTGTAATGTITDTFVTPFGNVDLTPLVDGFSTFVNPADNFLTTVDPSLVDAGDLGSILGSFGDVLQMF
jgi:hypothetical protein